MQDLADRRQDKLDTLERGLMEDRRNRQALQRALGFGLARISPTASFALAATHLAGTGLGLEEHFHRAAAEYRRAFADFQRAKTGGQASGAIMVMMRTLDEDQEPEVIDPHELPDFAYRRPPLRACVGGALGDIGLLVGFNVMFFAAAFVAFLNYDVR
jgi:hypothetical protein